LPAEGPSSSNPELETLERAAAGRSSCRQKEPRGEQEQSLAFISQYERRRSMAPAMLRDLRFRVCPDVDTLDARLQIVVDTKARATTSGQASI